MNRFFFLYHPFCLKTKCTYSLTSQHFTKKKTVIVKQTEINNFPIPLIRMTSNKLKPTIP